MSGSGRRSRPGLRTPEHAANLLRDLYVRLRQDLQRWAAVTHQTPQPRMGYVGQHLVSVVTGFRGGRSGARGDDLKLPGGKVGEIKCCYRVDQLGQCTKCRAAVASVESACPRPECRSRNVDRKDDSKWLISLKNEQELKKLFVPECFFLVLFEFEDLSLADNINVRIFEVSPFSMGFSLCMIDYFFNIKAKSASGAPFNLWPWSPKFLMMKPREIYWSVISSRGSIRTRLFPGRDEPRVHGFERLPDYARAQTFSHASIDEVAAARGVSFECPRVTKSEKLEVLQNHRENEHWEDCALADDFARAVYRQGVSKHRKWLRDYAPSF